VQSSLDESEESESPPRCQLPSVVVFGPSSARKGRAIAIEDALQFLDLVRLLRHSSNCARRRITSLKSPPGHRSLDKASTVLRSSQRRTVAASGSESVVEFGGRLA
jgi:hypothetical protein